MLQGAPNQVRIATEANKLDTDTIALYAFKGYEKKRKSMPRRERTEDSRIPLRPALREGQSAIEEHERVQLSRRDSLLVLDLLENPPAPNVKLRKAACAMPKRS